MSKQELYYRVNNKGNVNFSDRWDDLKEILDLNPNDTVLDVGSGRGHISKFLSENSSITATDFSSTQLKMNPPTGKDASDFLEFSSMYNMFFRNKVGKVMMVTALGNLGSTAGTFLAAGLISNGLI